MRSNQQANFFPRPPTALALETLLLESTQLSILEILYDPSFNIKIIRAFVPDFIHFISQLSIEASMPSLAKSYEERERSKSWGIIPTKEQMPDPFFNLDTLFEYHQIKLQAKRAELDQRFSENESEFKPALRTGLIEKIVGPLFRRLIEHSSALVHQLTGQGGIMDQTLNFMRSGGDQSRLECDIIMLSRTAEFFVEYLFRISKHFLSEHLYRKHEKVFLCFDELCVIIHSIMDFMESKKSIEEYSQEMLSIKCENIIEIEKMTPVIVDDLDFPECQRSLKCDIIELQVMKSFLQRSCVAEERIKPFNDLIAKFTFALNLLNFYHQVSFTWRSCKKAESAQAASRWIDDLLSDKAELRDMHSRSKDWYGENNFCPQIFQELFAVSEELIKEMSELRDNLYRAEEQFSKALQIQSKKLADEIDSGLKNLETLSSLVERFLVGEQSPQPCVEAKDTYEQLVDMVKRHKLGEEISEPVEKVCEKTLIFLDEKLNSITRLLDHANRFDQSGASSGIFSDFEHRKKQLSNVKHIFSALGALSPLGSSCETEELLKFAKARRKTLSWGRCALVSIRDRLDALLENQAPGFYEAPAIRIFSEIEATIKALQTRFGPAQVGHEILLRTCSLDEAHKAFFAEIYFPFQERKYEALLMELTQELSDISSSADWEGDFVSSPKSKSVSPCNSAKREREGILKESSNKTHHVNFSSNN